MKKRFSHTLPVTSAKSRAGREIGPEDALKALFEAFALPKEYTPHLEGASIDRSVPGVIKRELDFGNLKVRDSVSLPSGDSLIQEIEAASAWPASRLFVEALKAPATGTVFFRFTYLDDGREWEEGVPTELRKEAYRQKDRDITEFVKKSLAD